MLPMRTNTEMFTIAMEITYKSTTRTSSTIKHEWRLPFLFFSLAWTNVPSPNMAQNMNALFDVSATKKAYCIFNTKLLFFQNERTEKLRNLSNSDFLEYLSVLSRGYYLFFVWRPLFNTVAVIDAFIHGNMYGGTFDFFLTQLYLIHWQRHVGEVRSLRSSMSTDLILNYMRIE